VSKPSAASYTTAQLDACFLRFLADQTARPVVSPSRDKKGALSMFEPVIKTMSLSLFIVLAASNAPASDLPPSARARSEVDIERGWAEKLQQFDARLEARGLREADVPGAIISAPLPGFGEPTRSAAPRKAQSTAPAEQGKRSRESGPRY
jgi:hypothetical protein